MNAAGDGFGNPQTHQCSVPPIFLQPNRKILPFWWNLSDRARRGALGHCDCRLLGLESVPNSQNQIQTLPGCMSVVVHSTAFSVIQWRRLPAGLWPCLAGRVGRLRPPRPRRGDVRLRFVFQHACAAALGIDNFISVLYIDNFISVLYIDIFISILLYRYFYINIFISIFYINIFTSILHIDISIFWGFSAISYSFKVPSVTLESLWCNRHRSVGHALSAII